MLVCFPQPWKMKDEGTNDHEAEEDAIFPRIESVRILSGVRDEIKEKGITVPH